MTLTTTEPYKRFGQPADVYDGQQFSGPWE